ncbi:MAG: MoaD/ThiS family protein [Pseudomonadales bacterium]
MASVRVVFFASLRDATGMADCQVEANSLPVLLDKMRSMFVAEVMTALTADNVRIAVNQQLLAGEQHDLTLQNGDEVAFLPPVTGG